MKKIVSLILCALMVLSLAGCSEEAKLYEKYADIIDALEQNDYHGAMGKIVGMAVAEQTGNQERPEPVKVLCDDWYLVSNSYEAAPQAVVMREDGTCSVDGKEMLWIERHAYDTSVDGYIMNGGEHKYYFSLNCEDIDTRMPSFNLNTCRVDEENIYADQYVGDYRNHAQVKLPMVNWQKLDGASWMNRNFSLGTGSFYFNDKDHNWVITSDEGQMPLTIQTTSRNTNEETYTMTLEQRDDHYVLTVVSAETGDSAIYYNEEYGFEESWPEYKYPKVIEDLYDYLESGYFWADGADSSFRDNAALTYLNEQFKLLGNYKDSADYLARFSMIPSILTKVIQRTTDQLNNVSDSTLERYDYDNQGRLIFGEGARMIEEYGVYEEWGDFYLVYDAVGKVTGININKEPVTAVCTPTYNEAGQLESMHVQRTDRQYTATFTYDDQGRVKQLVIPYGSDSHSQYIYAYTYDENGHLIQKVKSWSEGRYKYVYDYTYEADAVVQQVESYQYRDKEEYSTTWVFTNDAQGRPLSAAVTTTQSSATFASREIVYQYEDLYFFDDTGMVQEDD